MNKELMQFKKGLLTLRGELEKERNRLNTQTRSLRRTVAKQELPDWSGDAMRLFSEADYTFWKLLRLLRKNKVL